MLKIRRSAALIFFFSFLSLQIKKVSEAKKNKVQRKNTVIPFGSDGTSTEEKPPKALSELQDKEIRFPDVCAKDDMKAVVDKFLQ